jgi:Na+/proline symporter
MKRTKNQIKEDRLISLIIYSFSLIGIGYFYGINELIYILICFGFMFFGFRVDKCNNDLEYKRYKK